MDNGPAKVAPEANLQKTPTAQVQTISIAGQGLLTIVDVTWKDGRISHLPAIWLRVYAPPVAKHCDMDTINPLDAEKGWLVSAPTIPEISYANISSQGSKISRATKEWFFNTLMEEFNVEIIKVVSKASLRRACGYEKRCKHRRDADIEVVLRKRHRAPCSRR